MNECIDYSNSLPKHHHPM